MPGVGTHAKSGNLGVNSRTPCLGVLVLLKHEDTSALAQHKTVTISVPRPRGRGGIIIAGRKCAHRGEATDAKRRNRCLGAPGNHDIGIAIFNDSGGFPNAMKPGRAGGHDSQIRPLEAALDRELSTHQVDDRTRDKKRADLAGAASEIGIMRIFNERQAANPRSDHGTNTLGI